MKAVLSNRIFLEVTDSYQRELEHLLTYKIPAYTEELPPEIIRTYSVIRPGLMSIPIGRIDLIPPSYEIVDKRVLAPTDFPKFGYELRASQNEVYEDISGNAMINANPSWGKTFTALAIAGKLGQKTLVVTHTVPLRNQWVKECEKVFRFKPGIIGSGSFDTSKPVTVGNTQTLSRKIPEISREFGTLLLDEMHHTSSPTFSTIIDKSYARYKIGLSGTLRRKDGKHIVFRDYFGDKIYVPPEENRMTPVVHIYKTKVPFQQSGPWAIRVNKLMSTPEYVHLVAMISAKYAVQGHNVLTLADRVEFIENVVKLVGPNGVAVTGKVKDERDLLISQVGTKYNMLGGTQSIFSEGISHSPFSCLVLGTPVNNEPLLEQLIGRVVRELEGKKNPVIVDINLTGHTAEKQAMARMGHYMRKGYKMETIWI
jgi:superfamily II DNA or RNA helicase